jgi:hypothetical protein
MFEARYELVVVRTAFLPWMRVRGGCAPDMVPDSVS